MENSILKSTKKILGLADDYTPFDHDIITHINSVFMTLLDLGVGTSSGFMIEDDSAVWDDFVSGDTRINAVRTYMFLKVRMYFDPPQNSFAVDAMERQIDELEWRINVRQEATDYVDPGTSQFKIDGMANAIQISAGLDWYIEFLYKDPDEVPVTNVIMDISEGTDERGRVLFTTRGSNPALVVDYSQSPLVRVTLPGAKTANMREVEAWFDAYATDPDGKRVQLCDVRYLVIEPNVSVL